MLNENVLLYVLILAALLHLYELNLPFPLIKYPITCSENFPLFLFNSSLSKKYHIENSKINK